MVLANDNFWGYTTDLIYRFSVTWLEAAIVQPCWTTMMVCYVEGDHGHLMGEDLLQQQFRTRVRGTAHSFHMPWENIMLKLKELHENDDGWNTMPHDENILAKMVLFKLRIGNVTDLNTWLPAAASTTTCGAEVDV